MSVANADKIVLALWTGRHLCAARRDEGQRERGGFDEVSAGDVMVHNLRAFQELKPDGIAKIVDDIAVMESPRAVPRFDDIVFVAGQLEWQPNS